MGTRFEWGKLIIFDRCRTNTSIYPLGVKDTTLKLELVD